MLALPRNVWLLAIVFSLSMSSVSMLMFVGGLIGSDLAPEPSLATLPIAAFVLGTASFAIPAAIFMQKLGRKAGGFLALFFCGLNVAFSLLAINTENFGLFVFASYFVGSAVAFLQQFRFAAIESLSDASQTPAALSVMMLFTIGGAIIGPELGQRGFQILPQYADYSGAYLLLAVVLVIAALTFGFFHNPAPANHAQEEEQRPLITIAKQPVFMIALTAAALGYALMSFLMTSTPLSMHEHHGFSLAQAKWVIQSHLIAMFLPSLFSGVLLKHLGSTSIIILGAILYLVVVAVALAGQAFLHYWWALVLLGVGWNFLFLGGTSLLPQAYRHSERFKAQALNDFAIFTLQALASLSAAWVLFRFGWSVQVLICVPFTLLILISTITYSMITKKRRNLDKASPEVPVTE
jgi:predicted MFS family arabinose efflux permease